jgi:hypothetical protein
MFGQSNLSFKTCHDLLEKLIRLFRAAFNNVPLHTESSQLNLGFKTCNDIFLELNGGACMGYVDFL